MFDTETPPLARGRPMDEDDDCAQLRNTPACAGKTCRFRWSGPCTRKHPRLRGEDAWHYLKHYTAPETPPLARGRRGLRRRNGLCRGNTPACAGKTERTDQQDEKQRKHPRLRGEDKAKARAPGLRGETPPLARGRLSTCGICRKSSRNTPACAGKTNQHSYPT